MTPAQIRVIAAICLLLVAGAMAWATRSLLRMESAQWRLTAEASIHERTRLALWRMETIAASLVVEESSRPPEHYRPFAAPDRSYTGGYRLVEPGALVVPSPLLSGPPARVLLHFEVEENGYVRSPEAPEGEERAIALNGHVSQEALGAAAARLAGLRAILAAKPDIIRVDRDGVAGGNLPFRNNHELLVYQNSLPAPLHESQAEGRFLRVGPPSAASDQNEWNQREAGVRQQVIENAVAAVQTPRDQQQAASGASSRQAPPGGAGLNPSLAAGAGASAPGAGSIPVTEAKATGPVAPRVTIGDFRPVWIGDALLLTREVTDARGSVIQGAWIDWERLRNELLDAVRDLFPDAQLVPETGDGAGTDRLASLPVRFTPEPADIPVQPVWSPLRLSLAAAWICVGLAAAAGGIMLSGMLALSDRRAAFVSSVTHELRTPLATFKLYSDMLAGGMVRDPGRRQEYLNTLTTEADRLGHLVENVLAYSRIEGGRKPGPPVSITVAALCRDLEPHLQSRAGPGGASLEITVDPAVSDFLIRTDPSAIRQILFNLVDNACKYGHDDGEPAEIRIRFARESRRHVSVSVTDSGPGVPRSEVRRLFRAFHKSARDAAHSAPGVGLGLALSRRLARRIGASLRLDPDTPRGARFVLTLPAVCNTAPDMTEIESRRPVWVALSGLFLDTELSPEDLAELATQLAESPYSIAELEKVLRFEVAPGLIANLKSPAGEWAGFDEQELVSRLSGRLGRKPLLRPSIPRMIRPQWDRLKEQIGAIRERMAG